MVEITDEILAGICNEVNKELLKTCKRELSSIIESFKLDIHTELVIKRLIKNQLHNSSNSIKAEIMVKYVLDNESFLGYLEEFEKESKKRF